MNDYKALRGSRLGLILLIIILLFSSQVTFSHGDAIVDNYWDKAYDVDYYVIVDAWDGGVNFRYGAGTEYSKITDMILNGNILHITMETIGSNGRTWGYTEWQGNYGWIALSEVSYYDKAAADAQAKAEEEAKAKAEEEAKAKAEEEAKAKAEEEAKAKAEEEAKAKAEEEAKAKAEEEAKAKAEEEAKAKAEEEAKAKAEEEAKAKAVNPLFYFLGGALFTLVILTVLILSLRKRDRQ